MNCLICERKMEPKPVLHCRKCNHCLVCGEQIGERGVTSTGPLVHIECAARGEAETQRSQRIARLRGKGILR